MAQLTLSEKAEMAAKTSFQQRTWMAFKDQARYWIEFPTPTLAEHTLEIQKKKRYAKTVLETPGDYGSNKAICEFMLNLYDADPPELDQNGELTDAVLLDSFASSTTYAAFAGVVEGDDQEAIEW